MTKTAESESRTPAGPAPLVITRHVHAPRETVYRAWTSAEQVRQWFAPASYTIPEAAVDPRPGGVFDVCMRSPSGERHWTRGVFQEMRENERLVIDMRTTDAAGRTLFTCRTEVAFASMLGGTRLEISQLYALVEPETAAAMIAGAREGWRTTLDKLEQAALRAHGASETGVRSVKHDTFRLERLYPAPAQRVWRALTEPDAKAAWFGGPPGAFELIERRMDVRPGGSERLVGRWEGGVVSAFEAHYLDVIPLERLVYSYEMLMSGRKISISLATMELAAEADGARLTVTEQGAFLDGYDDARQREHGTGLLLDALGAALAAP